MNNNNNDANRNTNRNDNDENDDDDNDNDRLWALIEKIASGMEEIKEYVSPLQEYAASHTH